MATAHQIKAALAARAVQVCEHLFPHGSVRGNEFRVGNLAGDPGESLKIDINGNVGRWIDFATGEKGGNLLDLWARARGLPFKAAISGATEWLDKSGADSQAGPHARTRAGRSEVVSGYDYLDEKGSLLFQVERLHPKRFRQRRPDGEGGWIRNLAGVRRVLYRLPEVTKAASEGRTIFVVEGEKDADSLFKRGLTATCNPGGAGKWRTEYSEALRGADVVVIPDNDEPGRRHADTICQSLFGVAASVRRIELPGSPAKGDVSDWLAAGHPTEELLALIEVTTPLRAAPKGTIDRPQILIRPGDLPSVVDAAEDALLQSNGVQIFQRGGVLVRVIRREALTVRRGTRRPLGALVIDPIESPYLVRRLTEAAQFYRFDGRAEEWKLTDAPERIAKTLLVQRGEWRFPSLVGIIEAPTLRADGSILDRPGYDPHTQLLFDPADTTFDPIPEEPTLDDARQSLALILELLRGFPFVEESDRAAAVAAILTGLVRKSFRAAPMFAFRAPKMRSGKTLLADLVAMIATGKPCSVMSAIEKPDEERKRLLAALLAGEPVICFDNIDRPFGGAAISQALTQETITDRLLGFSRMVTAPTNATFLATGNNLIFEGDITCRVIVCDINPKLERPEERVFDLNLYEYVPQHRDQLVQAALTPLRAYHVAGRPHQALTAWGGFDEWSGWVRSALVWTGMADPAAGRKRIEEGDPIRRRLVALLTAWEAVFAASSATGADAVKKAHESEALRSALIDVAGDAKGAINTRRLGNFLCAHENRIESGRFIQRAGQRSGAVLWAVTRELGESREFPPTAARECPEERKEEELTSTWGGGESTHETQETHDAVFYDDAREDDDG